VCPKWRNAETEVGHVLRQLYGHYGAMLVRVLYVWPSVCVCLCLSVCHKRRQEPDFGRRKRSRARPQNTWRMTFAEDLQGTGCMERSKELPAIVREGGILSPNVSIRTDGPKSKYPYA